MAPRSNGGTGRIVWWGMGLLASLILAMVTGIGGRVVDAVFIPRGAGGDQVAALESRLAEAERLRRGDLDAWRQRVDERHHDMERKLDLILWHLGLDPVTGQRVARPR